MNGRTQNSLRHYLVFCTGLFRLITFLVYPLSALGMFLYILVRGAKEAEGFTFVACIFVLSLAAGLEVFLDVLYMNGMSGKRLHGMNLFLTSTRGITVWKHAVILEFLRKILYVGICYVITVCSALDEFRGVEAKAVLYFFAILGFVAAGILISRAFMMAWWNMILGMFVLNASMFLGLMIFLVPMWTMVLLGILGVGLMGFLLITSLRKGERSYYEES